MKMNMKKIFGLAVVAFFAMSMANCASGPSCTTVSGTSTVCIDYSKAGLTAAQVKDAEAGCTGSGATWAAAPCAAGTHACTDIKASTITGTVDMVYTNTTYTAAEWSTIGSLLCSTGTWK